MTQIKKTIAGLAFAAGCIVLFAGCEREDDVKITVPVRSNRPIGVNVTATGATRSVEMTTAGLETSEGFVLDVYANDTWYDLFDTHDANFGLPDMSNEHPKGIYIKSEGKVNVKYSSGHISDASGYGHDGDETDFWYLVDGSGNVEPYNWITGGHDGDKDFYLRFWARYPKDADVDAAAEGVRKITVEPDPDGTTETFTYALPTHVEGLDATNQKDILFAYNAVHKEHTDPVGDPSWIFPVIDPSDPDPTDNVNLTFNHALSMINFCVSPDDATFDVSLRINSIEITNVPKGGACTFNGNGTIAGKNMFVWNTSSYALGSYSQTYNASFESPSSATGWKISEYGSATPKKHVYTCSNAFMLIPHKPRFESAGSSDNAQITIEFFDMDAGATITKTIDLNKDGDVWSPGYYYTYKIKATKVGSNIYPAVYLTAWDDITSTHNIY